ncbi:hypothetical protein LTR35_005579 [Friedmanniomyces endolithicus]|uniref:Cytochrome b561 domain-containing protein n=1 Tax=Friedmanniomyces endolithicus TaxID=329885 RepID=A0AAN6FPJ5_9PEZI|nr:hypothetical protein LTR35_005579 [Friedmanniomyces endolithicus]KAK0297608.1 hypothetical protein LTS00_003740 [Friedmanniomyces endolithicus]KAK0322082.1 hypothetical protein LTR82_007056 [Friedmanniomyces endolithicus]KAK1009013.1 hypothetical protein LTR54_005813 [Friedmanniomyces endolithicus]
MGAIVVRVAGFKMLVWIHVAIEALALVSYGVAVGLGLYLAINLNLLDQAHPFIGLVLSALLLMQPILGLVHHRFYKKHTGRTMWSYAHLSFGRLSIFLGLINGGLGLQLAFAGPRAKMIYGIVAGVVGVCYLAAIALGETKRKRTHSRQDEKEHNGRDTVGSGSRAVAPSREVLWASSMTDGSQDAFEEGGTRERNQGPSIPPRNR